MAKATTRTEQAKAEPKVAKVLRERAPIKTVQLEAPVADGGPVTSTHLDVRLTPRQAKGLRVLFDGLQAEGIQTRTLAAGKPRPIERPHDAIRWVLDEIADAASVA